MASEAFLGFFSGSRVDGTDLSWEQNLDLVQSNGHNLASRVPKNFRWKIFLTEGLGEILALTPGHAGFCLSLSFQIGMWVPRCPKTATWDNKGNRWELGSLLDRHWYFF